MFAPKVAKPQTKPTEGATSKVEPHRSTLVGQQVGHGPVEQAPFLQRTIGNQATPRLTQSEGARSIASTPTRDDQPERIGEDGPVETAGRGVSWNFNKIPLLPPEPSIRNQSSSVRRVRSALLRLASRDPAYKPGPPRNITTRRNPAYVRLRSAGGLVRRSAQRGGGS